MAIHVQSVAVIAVALFLEQDDMNFSLRDFQVEDATAVNEVALAAYDEYRPGHPDWPAMAKSAGNMASLAEQGEIIVATAPEVLLGAVVYVGPERPKQAFFDPDWPIIRMLSVHPKYRGMGLGRALTEECIRRAERDEASCIALHTTSIMKVAQTMYERMGFTFHKDCPLTYGLPYGVYLKRLRGE